MLDPERWTQAEMMERAASGLGKIDLWGAPRAATAVTVEEIEAMAGALAAYGLTPIYPELAATASAPAKAPLQPLRGPGDADGDGDG